MGNHPEDDFMPLEAIRRSHGVIGKRIPFEFEGEAFEPEPSSQRGCAKDSIAIQTCELSEEEFNDFLALYPIPPAYHVILPKSNQTIFDAPPGYVHISRLNPFGCAKLTTFVVMCKAYGCEPTVELFQGFFNLCRAGKWLTFTKRPEKHIPHLFPKVITCIDGWKERFFYVQNFIVPAKYPQLLLEQNKFDSKSYKDKLPLNIKQNPMFQQMAFRNFVYAKDEEYLSFLPKEPSHGFGTGSPFTPVNIEPLRADDEPVLQPAKVMADSGGSPKPELFVVHPGSVAAWIKDRKCKTKGGSSRPDVYTAITKAGIKLLLHSAHFSCSWDTLGISTLKASAADT
ncbi:hypothetical protein Tco_0439441 [Tanacetum coccineum]